jgi:iron complex transport system substrate-binding protein
MARPPEVRVPETSRNRTLGLSRALMLAAFGMIVGRLVWRAAPLVHRAEAVAASPAVTALDSRGRKLALATPPRRIVSLSPGTTEMLFALGLQGRIVADTNYCDYPPAAKALPKIGDVETSLEKVVAQQPDLVVADAVANRRAIEPLERLHLPVFTVPQGNLTESLAALEMLGRATAHTSQSASLVRSLRSRIDDVQQTVGRYKSEPKVLDIVQMEPLMVVGSSNFMDDLISLAGGVNAARNAGSGWAAYSPEKVAADRPDVILAGRSGVDAIRRRSGWASVPAVRNGRVYSLRSETARPGPRSVDALEELARLLHPHAFAPQ